jgi:hypothetical protein
MECQTAVREKWRLEETIQSLAKHKPARKNSERLLRRQIRRIKV